MPSGSGTRFNRALPSACSCPACIVPDSKDSMLTEATKADSRLLDKNSAVTPACHTLIQVRIFYNGHQLTAKESVRASLPHEMTRFCQLGCQFQVVQVLVNNPKKASPVLEASVSSSNLACPRQSRDCCRYRIVALLLYMYNTMCGIHGSIWAVGPRHP